MLAGGRKTIAKYRPIVQMEVNISDARLDLPDYTVVPGLQRSEQGLHSQRKSKSRSGGTTGLEQDRLTIKKISPTIRRAGSWSNLRQGFESWSQRRAGFSLDRMRWPGTMALLAWSGIQTSLTV